MQKTQKIFKALVINLIKSKISFICKKCIILIWKLIINHNQKK